MQTSPQQGTVLAQLTLSVLVPVYNERYLVEESLRRLAILSRSPWLRHIQVIVVDDGSTDGTTAVLKKLQKEFARAPGDGFVWQFVFPGKNQGKGHAVRLALTFAQGDITVIHDADLEYNPRDLLRVFPLFVEEDADAVFGSRFAGGDYRRALFFHHDLGNRFLTTLCNLVSNLNITDMETCYKVVRTHLLKSIPLVSNDFRLEPEIVIKLAKRGARVYEVPISYAGRTYEDGKKIGWRDGLRALSSIARFGVSDHVYVEDVYSSQLLNRLSKAHRFNAWMAEMIRPYCGDRILEIGAGAGHLTQNLTPRPLYVACDINPNYLQALQRYQKNRPYFMTTYCDIADRSTFPQVPQGFDTVICLNVLENTEDDQAALRNVRACLVSTGTAIVLVPHGPWNYGTLDHVLGHRRRYSEQALVQLAEQSGFVVKQLMRFNRLASAGWFLNGKILRRNEISRWQMQALNGLTPLLKRIDAVLPLPSLSLIAILTAAPPTGLSLNDRRPLQRGIKRRPR